jgi:hypothetical protein
MSLLTRSCWLPIANVCWGLHQAIYSSVKSRSYTRVMRSASADKVILGGSAYHLRISTLYLQFWRRTLMQLQIRRFSGFAVHGRSIWQDKLAVNGFEHSNRMNSYASLDLFISWCELLIRGKVTHSRLIGYYKAAFTQQSEIHVWILTT